MQYEWIPAPKSEEISFLKIRKNAKTGIKKILAVGLALPFHHVQIFESASSPPLFKYDLSFIFSGIDAKAMVSLSGLMRKHSGRMLLESPRPAYWSILLGNAFRWWHYPKVVISPSCDVIGLAMGGTVGFNLRVIPLVCMFPDGRAVFCNSNVK